MDTSALVVIALFVLTILSSVGGKGTTPAPTPSQQPTFSQVAMPNVPDPGYFEKVGESHYEKIKAYVSKYRQPAQAEQIASSIVKYSKVYGVNPRLVAALMARESRFNPRAISSSGAVGLGQLLPSTCTTVGINNPYDIDQNAKGTTRYMKYLLDKFKKHKQRVEFSIAGYLEGPNAIARKLSYKPHTRAYLKDILSIYQKI